MGNMTFPTINFFRHLFLWVYDHRRLLVQYTKTTALLHRESWHMVCRRFHCGPWILSLYFHPYRTESSSGLRKSCLLRREIPLSSSKDGREQSSVPLLYISTVHLLPGAITHTCWGNTMDHQLDVSVYLSHRAGRVHTTARGSVQRGTRTLEKQKQPCGSSFI